MRALAVGSFPARALFIDDDTYRHLNTSFLWRAALQGQSAAFIVHEVKGMVETVELSEYFSTLAHLVMMEHEDLHWIRSANVSIGFVESDRAKKSNGRLCLGECVKVKELYKPYCPHDFLVVVYSPNVQGMSEEQLKILLYHELLHVGMSEDGEEVKYIVNPHDVEDFRKIIDRYGLDWAKPSRTTGKGKQ